MQVTEVQHPLVKHKIGLMRAITTPTQQFRDLTTEVSCLLFYAATTDLALDPATIQGWDGPVQVQQIVEQQMTLVPLLRAGLGMVPGILHHFPSIPVSIVGLYRDEETLQPVLYFQKLASDLAARMIVVVDMMLATGGSMSMTLTQLKQAGCQQIKVLVLVAAPEGIALLERDHPDVHLYTAAIDRCLNAKGYILPGLGDAGDRLFGTR